MKKLKKVEVGKKGFYGGTIIKAYQHNYFIEEKKDYFEYNYAYACRFGDVYFAYQFDEPVEIDVDTHLFSTFKDAEEFVNNRVNSLDKAYEDFNAEIEEAYEKSLEFLQNPKNSFSEGKCRFGEFVKEFPGFVFVNKSEDGKYVVYTIDPILERGPKIQITTRNINTIDEAFKLAKTYSIGTLSMFSDNELKDIIIKLRNLRIFGFIIKEYSNGVILSFGQGLFHVYLIDEMLNVLKCTTFLNRHDAEIEAQNFKF